MNSLTIELTFVPEAFREIYLENGHESFWSNNSTRRPLLFTLLFAACTYLFYLLAFRYNDSNYIFLFALFACILLVSCFYFWRSAKYYFVWRKSVKEYIRTMSKYSKQLLIIGSDSFELSNSDETFIERWEFINHASIHENYVRLISKNNDHYLFPKKCMPADQYELLKTQIRECMKGKIKNSE